MKGTLMDLEAQMHKLKKILDASGEYASVTVIEESGPGKHVLGVEPRDGGDDELFFVEINPT
jgi:hypothetical protein